MDCIVCGKAVDPTIDIMLQAGGKSLVPVHRGACSDTARSVVTTGRDLLEARIPWLKGLRKAVKAIMTNGED